MNKNPIEQFRKEAVIRAKLYQSNKLLQESANAFLNQIVNAKYAYNFFWLGVPIIQAPQDLQALQEIIWKVKPDFIIETGVAWGGSLIFYASMLALLELCGEIKEGRVLGIDIDIRKHNHEAIGSHPLRKHIFLLQGSSIDTEVIADARILATERRTLVCLDSNHTHEHVLAELKAYAPLVSKGSYCVVNDTGIEDLSDTNMSDRPWGKGNNPRTAVQEYLKTHTEFEVDRNIEDKLLITASRGGYLKRVR